MVKLEQVENGVLLPVQAHAKARRNAVAGVHDGRLKVAVTQAPEKGKANEAIIKLLADWLGIKRRQLTLVSGETSSRKQFLVTELTLPQLQHRITECLDGDG